MIQLLIFHNRYEFTISPNPIIFPKLLHLMHLAHYNFVIYDGFLSHASTFPKFQSFFGRGIKLQLTSNALQSFGFLVLASSKILSKYLLRG